MSRKKIWILASIMGIALVGLIAIQTQYFISADEIRREQFNHQVNKALDKVINYFEDQEAMAYMKKGLGLKRGENDELEESLGLVQKDYIDIDQKVRFYIGKGNNVEPKINTLFSIFEKDSLVYSVNDSQSKHKASSGLSQSAMRIQMRLQEKFENQTFGMRQLANNMVFSNKTLKERLSDFDVYEVIKDKLSDSGINLPFEYAIKSEGRYIDLSKDYINQDTDYRFKKRLFPSDVLINDNTLHLIFPSRDSFISRSFVLLIPSLLVSLLLIISCAFTIFTIIRQKKLSAIKNDFINNMTHEFKTPISTISLASQMLKDGSVTNSPDMVDHIAKIVRDESKRLTFQVEKVLQMAMFSESRMKLKLKVVNVHELIYGLFENFQLKVEDRSGQIHSSLVASSDNILADEVHVANVISNLLDNALKYCMKKPNISISTYNKNEGIVISVVDNGIGISRKEQKLIFERFYRVSTGNVHDVKGFGLGLSYVKKIVEAHGGNINVDSTLHKGSKFELYFPLSTKNKKVKKSLIF